MSFTESKKWWQSKTLYFNALSIIVAVAGLFGFGDFQPDARTTEIVALVAGVGNVILRTITKTSIEK